MFFFKGLDYVISEAKRHGIHLILSLANNWNDFGGRKQYVEWAKNRGQHLNNDDEFFTNPITKRFYKDHIKVSHIPYLYFNFPIIKFM